MRRAAAGAVAKRKNAKIRARRLLRAVRPSPAYLYTYVALHNGPYNASTPLLSTERLRDVSPTPFRLAQAFSTPTSTPHICTVNDTSTHGQHTAPFPPLSTESLREALTRRTVVPRLALHLADGTANGFVDMYPFVAPQGQNRIHGERNLRRTPSQLPLHPVPSSPSRTRTAAHVRSAVCHPLRWILSCTPSHLLHLPHISLMPRGGGRKLRMVVKASALSNELGAGGRCASKKW